MLNPDLCVKQRIQTAINMTLTVAVFPKAQLLVINEWKDCKLNGTYKFSTACKLSDRPDLLELAERAGVDPVVDTIGELLTLFV